MYKVTKSKGSGQNVILMNTDTAASINLGRISIKILDIIKEDGYSAEAGTITMTDEWDLKISSEAKDKLARLAMPMSKPIRDQRKKPKEKTEHKSTSGDVDIFNLIYGNVD